MKIDNLYLKYLIRSHVVIGLFVMFVFYIATYFGTITLFKPYVNTWQNPSRHFVIQKDVSIDINEAIKIGLEVLKYPEDNVKVIFPTFYEKALRVRYGFSETVYIDPYTNTILNTQNENNFLTNFFNRTHINLNIPTYGIKIVGLASIAMLFLLVSGVFMWYLSRKKEKKNVFLKWHKSLSLLILPYILIFSLTGAVIGIILSNTTPFALSASNGVESNTARLVKPIISSTKVKLEKLNERTTMQSFSDLYKKAQNIYPNMYITRMILNNWNDKNANVLFQGYDKGNKILTADNNRIKIILKGENGELLSKYDLSNSHIMSKSLSAFYYFHYIFDEGLYTRLAYLLGGILFGSSLVFGMFIWIERKINQATSEIWFYQYISKFTMAFTFGIIPSTCFVLVLYWMIPFDYLDRSIWIKGGFYAFWSFTLLYSTFSNKHLNTIKFYTIISAILLFLSVYLHGDAVGISILESYNIGLYDIFYIDLVLLALGFLSLLVTFNINKVNLFNRLEKF